MNRPAARSPAPSAAPFVLLDDARTGHASAARLYSNPVRCLRARTAGEFDRLLEELKAAGRGGLHAAGYLAYEAGLALEPRLRPLLHRLPRVTRQRRLLCSGAPRSQQPWALPFNISEAEAADSKKKRTSKAPAKKRSSSKKK